MNNAVRLAMLLSSPPALDLNFMYGVLPAGVVVAGGARLDASGLLIEAAQPDDVSMTGADFTRWFNPNEGTLLIEAEASASANCTYVAISNGATGQNSLYIDNDSGNLRAVVFSGSSAVAVLNLSSVGTAGTVNRIAVAYRANDFAASRNGGTVIADTAGAVPLSPVQMDIGRSPNGVATTYLNNHMRRIRYWRRRLPDSTLQRLTA